MGLLTFSLNITLDGCVDHQVKNGRLYDGNTLDELWPRVKPLPTQWWWRENPPSLNESRRP